MKLRRQYTFSLLNQAGQTLVLAAIMVLVARTLGPAGKGAIGVALALAALVATATHLSLGSGISYLAGKHPERLGALAINAVLYSVVAGGAATAVVWTCRESLAQMVRLESGAALVGVVALLLLPTYFVEFGTALLAGSQRFDRLLAANCVSGVAFLGIFAVVLSNGGSVYVAAVVFALYRAVRALALWGLVPWTQAGALRSDRGLFRTTLAFGLQGHGGTILQIAVYRLDLLLLNILAGTTAAGLYTAATFFAELLLHAPQALALVMLPASAARDPEERRRMAGRLCRQTVAATGLASVVLAAGAAPLVPLVFGEAFADATPAVWLLLPGIVTLAVSKVLVPAIAGGGWPWAGSCAAALGLVLTVGLDLALIPRWGFRGAALASSLAYAGQTAFVVYLFRRQTGAALGEILRPRAGDFTFASASLPGKHRA